MRHNNMQSLDARSFAVKFSKLSGKMLCSFLDLSFCLWEPLHDIVFMELIVDKVDVVQVFRDNFLPRQSLGQQFRYLVAVGVLDFVFLVLAEHVVDSELGLPQSFAKIGTSHHGSHVRRAFNHNLIKLSTHHFL